jgi:hypothetical protein
VPATPIFSKFKRLIVIWLLLDGLEIGDPPVANGKTAPPWHGGIAPAFARTMHGHPAK